MFNSPPPGCHASLFTSDAMTAALYYHPRRLIGWAVYILGIGLIPPMVHAEPSLVSPVQASWGQQVVSDGQHITLTFEGTVSQWGPLVLMVGDTDVTHLFKPVSANQLEGVWSDEVAVSGEQTFKILRVSTSADGASAASATDELAAWPMLIEPPRLSVKAKGSIGIKSQSWGEWSGAAVPLARPTYVDGNSQLSVSTDYGGDDLTAQSEWQFLGSSARPEAVRYPLARQDASKPDLVSYNIKVQRSTSWGQSTLAAGQVTMDAHPLLAPSYANRGLVLTHAFDSRLDVSLGVQSGGRVLGVRNLSGVEDSDSLFTSARVGYEFMPERAGALRGEVGWFQGRLKPAPLLNVAPSPTQVQRSQGWGVRLLGSTEEGRLSGELNWANSRYASDDSQQLTSSTGGRQAHNWSVNYQLVPALTEWHGVPVDLSVGVREDLTPTLFRSLGGGPAGDDLGRELTLNGTVGIVSLGLLTNMNEDNVDNDALMLKNLRRQRGIDVSFPLSKLPGVRGLIQSPQDSVWWPQLSYNELQSHAWGDPDHLPDWALPEDLENVQTVERKVGLVWKPAGWTVACRWLSTFQDNRQATYATQDMRSRGLQLEASWRIHQGLKLGVTAAHNRQRLLDTAERNLGRKLGLDVQWLIWPNVSLKGTWTHQQTLDAFGATRKAIDTLQLSLNGKTRLPDWSYTAWTSDRLQGLWFVRLATSDNRSESDVAYLNYVAFVRSLQLGFSVAF